MSLIKGMVSGVIGAIIFIIFLFILDIGMVVSIPSWDQSHLLPHY